MAKPTIPAPGAKPLADLVQQATSGKGWRRVDLARHSYAVMEPHSEGRKRIGLSNRTWEKVWRADDNDQKMDDYSYVTIDKTLDLPPGTSRAVHLGEEPPEFDQVELRELRAEVDGLREQMRGMMELLTTLLGRRDKAPDK